MADTTGRDDITVTRRSTSTVVDFQEPAVVNQDRTCTATVTDTETLGTKTDPTGTVTFTIFAGPGAFTPASGTCTLLTGAPDDKSSCTVTYTPSAVGTGTHTIRASYGGSDVHLTSADTTGDDITVTRRSTSTVVSCTPNPVTVPQSTTCKATVSDIEADGTKAWPQGTVSFGNGGGSGTFASNPCNLTQVGTTTTSSCTVTYTTSGADSGTHTIKGMYSGSSVHATSEGTFGLTVNKRQTQTTIVCGAPAQIGSTVTCTATVEDKDLAGSKSDPTGMVRFTSDGTGTFSAAPPSVFTAPDKCTLVPDSNPSTYTSSCSVNYSSAVVAVDEINAHYLGSNVHAPSDSETGAMAVFYDPNAGFVTGGGWINFAGVRACRPGAHRQGQLRLRLQVQEGRDDPDRPDRVPVPGRRASTSTASLRVAGGRRRQGPVQRHRDGQRGGRATASC